MLVLAPLTLLVAAVGALQNPHRKVTQRAPSSHGLSKRNTPLPQTNHQYLNEHTESKLLQICLPKDQTN